MNKLIRSFFERDSYKLMLLFLLLTVLFFAMAVKSGVWLYNIVNRPLEYVFSSYGETISDRELEAVCRADGVFTASRSVKAAVTFKYNGSTAEVDAEGLSGDYISSAYGISDKSDMLIFYMNKAAYGKLCDAVGKAMSDENEISVSYLTDDGVLRSARIVVTEAAGADDAYTFYREDILALRKGASQIRIRFNGYDMTGTEEKAIIKMGFTPADYGAVLDRRYEAEARLAEIHYKALIMVICAAAFFSVRYAAGESSKMQASIIRKIIK